MRILPYGNYGMYRKILKNEHLTPYWIKTHGFLNLFSCRFEQILTLINHDKHNDDYDFMFDFMYIVAPPSPLNTAHFKGRLKNINLCA